MFVVLVLSRLFLEGLANRTRMESLKMLSLIRAVKFDFVGKRMIAGALSLLLIVGTWFTFFPTG